MIGSNAIISAQRYTESAGQEIYDTAHVTGVSCYIESLQPELAQFWDASGTLKMFRCLTDEVVDIQETDKITDDQGTVYRVQSVQHYNNNVDVLNHSELIISSTYVKP